MLDKAKVTAWLEAYVHAWKTYDSEDIGNLFSEDATCAYDPFSEMLHGRTAIVASWFERKDAPDTYDGHYEPIAIEGNRAVTQGRSQYFESDGTTLKTEFDNIFVLDFDNAGCCTAYREWYMERPRG
ncbi:MAG: nuclear transport factor 2 family protein [Ktedonobacteraceae bacterium]